MIKIRKGDVYLDLGETKDLTFEKKAGVFETGVSSKEFSYPFEMPINGNEESFGFEHSLDAVNAMNGFEVELETSTGVKRGFLSIEGYKYNMNKKKGTVNCNIGGDDNRFYKFLEGKKLNEFNLGRIEIPTYTVPAWAKFDIYLPDESVAFSNVCHWAGKVTKGEVEADCVFPTVYMPDLLPYDKVPLTGNEWHQPLFCINFWGSMQQNNNFGGAIMPGITFPDDEYPPLTIFKGDETYGVGAVHRQRIVPMFRMIKILKRLFEVAGYVVVGDFINEQDYMQPFVFNNYAVNKWRYDSSFNITADPDSEINGERLSAVMECTDDCTEIVVSNHVPAVDAAEWVNSALLFLGLRVDFEGGNKAVFRRLKNFLTDIETYSEPFLLNDEYVKQPEIDDVGNANELEYTFSDIAGLGELLPDDKLKKLNYEEDVFSDLVALEKVKLNESGITLINQRVNMYFDDQWNEMGYNFLPFEDEQTTALAFEPMRMIHGFGVGYPTHLENYWMPVNFGGGTIFGLKDDNADTWTLDDSTSEFNSLIGLYFGLQLKPDDADPYYQYPYAAYSHKSFYGDYGNYHLGMTGEEGFREYFRGDYGDLIANNKGGFDFVILIKGSKPPQPMQYIFIEGHRFLIVSTKVSTNSANVVAIKCYKL